MVIPSFFTSKVKYPEKEKFIRESLEYIEDVDPNISDLSKRSDKEIDELVEWYDYLWDK